MLQIMIERAPSPSLVTIEYKNVRPVDLIDLARSFQAFGEAFSDFAYEEGFDAQARNVRLYVHQLRSGSIIGELAPYLEQASWVLDEAKTLAPFINAIAATTNFFLGRKGEGEKEPSRRSAEQIHTIVEPTARDQGSNLIIGTNSGMVFQNCTFTSQEANAIQNSAKRYLAPHIPDEQRLVDQTLILHQVRGDLSKAAGDRGIIKAVSPKHVKLSFASPDAKRLILDAHDNPFRMGFLVDVLVKAVDGKPGLYRVLEVKDSFDLPE